MGVEGLCEDTADLDRPGFGGPIGLPAFDVLEFFRPSGDAGQGGLDVEHLDGNQPPGGGPLVHPAGSSRPAVIDHALDLPARGGQTGTAAKGFGSMLKGALHGPGPAHQLGDSRGVKPVKPQPLIQGKASPIRAAEITTA